MTTFKPMLAASVDHLGALRYPLLASAKLDGVRCVVRSGVALSRSLKPLPNEWVQRLFGRPELDGCDGELIVGNPTAPDVWQRTSSAVMSQHGESDVHFYIFDNFNVKREFEERLYWVEKLTNIMQRVHAKVHAHRHVLIENKTQLLSLEEEYLKAGYEGVMLRDPKGPYKYGRSTLSEGYLLKLKRFKDGEAVILSVAQLFLNKNEAKRNALGHLERSSHKAGKVPVPKMGALHVRDLNTGVTFDIGSGFTDEQRVKFWRDARQLIGRTVRYRHQPTGIKDRPRFPVFQGFRDERDMS